MKKVLVTGAAGKVGQLLARAWANEYRLTLIDLVKPRGGAGATFILGDANDIDLLRANLQDANAMIHLATSGHIADGWDDLVPTAFTATWSAFQAASDARCERVVFASSLNIDLRPQKPYSAAKLWGEMLARRYTAAHELSVICLRLGTVAAYTEPALSAGNRRLGYVLTFQDLIRLFTCAVEAPAAVRFGVFNGISNRRHPRFSIEAARTVLGYEPRDDVYALARRALVTPAGIWSLVRRSVRKARRIVSGKDSGP